MKKIGIMGALSAEVDQILLGLSDGHSEQYAGVEYHHGRRGGFSVVACCAGMGKANAASTTQVLITKYGVDAILFSGIAGNTSSELALGDVVIGRELVYHDATDEMLADSAPFTALYRSDPRLVDAAEQGCRLAGVKYKIGRIATGDRFIDDGAVKLAIVAACHPDCVEMEGAAVAQVAMRNDIPFVVLRAMSDNADQKLAFTGEAVFDISQYVTTASAITVAAIDALRG